MPVDRLMTAVPFVYISCVLTIRARWLLRCLFYLGVMDILVDGLIASALIDTGSTETFISKAFAVKHSLKIHPSSGHVSLASFSQTCKIDVYRLVKSVVEDNTYYNTKLLVMENLCKVILLLPNHKDLTIRIKGLYNMK